MSTFTYKLIRSAGWPFFWVSTRPTFLHRERARMAGGYILAANHLSPYDVPCLMAASPRDLDFVSIVEMRRKPLVRMLFTAMNAVFLDRGRVDAATTRQVLRKLAAGRVVAMFPEGGIRREHESVLAGGPINPGVAKLAQAARVPIVPCAILDSGVMSRFTSWLPTKSARYGVAFGEPVTVGTGPDEHAARTDVIDTLRARYRALYLELCTAMRREALPVAGPAGSAVSAHQ